MKKTCSFLLVLSLAVFLTQCGPRPPAKKGKKTTKAKVIAVVADGKIVVDGDAGDWEEIGFLVKRIGLEERGKFPPRIDLKSAKAARDSGSLYLLLEAEPVSAGIAHIYIDSDGSKTTGVYDIMLGKKGEFPKLPQGWDYIIKLTYSSYTDGGRVLPMLTSQVEKFLRVEYGYMSKLVFGHKNNKDNPAYVGARGVRQELRIPLKALNIKPPTDIAFLFVEGTGNVFTEYSKHCKFVKAVCE